jgi:membrane peptidoglycan carboxypeptidase
MAAAVNAVANSGELLEPKVVQAIIRNGVRTEMPHRVIRRAISSETASEMTSIMESVVERGTARAAQVPGYKVAGKTGTAEKIVDGRYSDEKHNASFVGFVPSRQPVLTILVMIDTPRGEAYTGGAVAAPIFQRIAETSLRHLTVTPTINPLTPMLLASQTKPRLDLAATSRRTSTMLVPGVEASTHRGLMPDLRGMSAREAVDSLISLGVTTRLEGIGFVSHHEPGPGTVVNRGMVVALRLERQIFNHSNLTP